MKSEILKPQYHQFQSYPNNYHVVHQQHHPNNLNSLLEDKPNYFVWEQNNVTLIRNPDYGYGIAISGGRSSNSNSSSIYVSDIIKGGPAQHKLMLDDILLSINGVNVENVEHSFVIRLLKEAKEFIHLVIKRKVKNSILLQQQHQQLLPNNYEVKNTNHHYHNTIEDIVNEDNPIIIHQQKRNNAIQQTALQVMSNFQNSNQQQQSSSSLINESHSVSSLKPIKVNLSKQDKKDTFGLVIGCKFYIKEIQIPSDSSSSSTSSVSSDQSRRNYLRQLKRGDILLKVNDHAVDQFSLNEINKLLTKNNKLSLTVKRNNSSFSKSPIPSAAAPEEIKDIQQQPQVEYQEDIPDAPPRNKNKEEMPAPPPPPVAAVTSEVRVVEFCRENGIGIRLSGGNRVGIYICDVQYGSPAERAGLHIADKILSVNDLNYADGELTREQAVQHILSLKSMIRMHVQHNWADYETNCIQDKSGGDSFYVRAHFSYKSSSNPAVDTDLNFQMNDILHVTDTLYNGVIGKWIAAKQLNKRCIEPMDEDEDVEDEELTPLTLDAQEDVAELTDIEFDEVKGTIPNEATALNYLDTALTVEQLIKQQKQQQQRELRDNQQDSQDTESETNQATSSSFNLSSIGASARLSIRKKLLSATRNSSRSKSASRSETIVNLMNGKTEVHSDTESSHCRTTPKKDNKVTCLKANTHSSCKYTTYERVCLRPVHFIRPVVLFGPLADVAREKLITEMPQAFDVPESSQSQDTMGGVIKLASIKQIIDQGKHCLLDVTPNAVEHLNYAQYFPICIYLRSESKAHLKQLRMKYAKNLRANRSCKRLWDTEQKMSKHYAHLFTGQISLQQAANAWFRLLKRKIGREQKRPVWISVDLDKQLKMEQLKQQQQQMQLQNNQCYLVDDNFEFPIYTTTIQQQQQQLIEQQQSYNVFYEEQQHLRNYFDEEEAMMMLNPAPATTTPITTNLNRIQSNSDPMLNKEENNEIQKETKPKPKKNKKMLISNEDNNNWRKFATYSANSLKNAFLQLKNQTAVPAATSSPKTIIHPNSQLYNQSLIDRTVNGLNVNNEQNEQFIAYHPKGRMMMMEQHENNPDLDIGGDLTSPAAQQLRNTLSYSSYKLIKNSQSSLMPGQAKNVIEKQPNYSNENTGQFLLKPASASALLIPSTETQINNNLNSIEKLRAQINDLTLMNSSKQNQYFETSTSTTNNSSFINNEKEKPIKPPPPTLPKPKKNFILPQASATQSLILQRNLKSKSELNISMPNNTVKTGMMPHVPPPIPPPPVVNKNKQQQFHSSSCSSSLSSSSSTNNDQQQQQQSSSQSSKTNKLLDTYYMNIYNNQQQMRQQQQPKIHSSSSSSSEDHSFEASNNNNNNNNSKSYQSGQAKLAKKSTATPSSSSSSPSCLSASNTDQFRSAATAAEKMDLLTNSSASDDNTGHEETSVLTTTTTQNINNKQKEKQQQSSSCSSNSSMSSSSQTAATATTKLNSNSTTSFSNMASMMTDNINNTNQNNNTNVEMDNQDDTIELPIYYQTSNEITATNQLTKNSYSDLYSNEAVKYRITTYTAHYNDKGFYRKLLLNSNSNCSIIASANGIFDYNGGILESADTGVSLTVPEGAIAQGCSFDLYFKVCHCKSTSPTSGEILTEPIVMCGPRGIRFLKPVELQIPHFISIDGQSWSYAFKAIDHSGAGGSGQQMLVSGENNNNTEVYNWNANRFKRKVLLNSVNVLIDSF